ncbi:hypothetical protein PNOK_0883900 [Pyrrhoderma noxium]|uniref:DUF6534 domain-containing protein n=1 Tax=Pyrrhoderma noxium TaxID=2282107 RepID=A0A286U8S0_9AGAM|nr:hypothetical protein PNOK_0883900 [Pyrrhoderma noxium]
MPLSDISSSKVSTAVEVQSYYQCLFLSCTFTVVLWGISVIQLYAYFKTHCKNDSWKLRCYVVFVFCLNTAHQCTVSRWGYHIFVEEPGNELALVRLNAVELPLITMLTALVDVMVQAYYISRIWNLSKRNILLAIVVSTATIGQFTATLYYFSKIYNLFVVIHTGLFINISRVLYATTAFVEIFLSSVFVILMHRMRNGQKRSETVINRLILYTISSSAVNAAFAIAAVVSAVAAPNVYIHLLFASLAPNLYTDALLALLNTRTSIWSVFDSNSTDETEITTELFRGQIGSRNESLDV